MNNNDSILLKQLINQKQEELAPDQDMSEFFEWFVAEQALKDRNLSYDEISDGIVDGGGDGGIDGVYMFVNNVLVRETVDENGVRRKVPIELVFIQAKTETGFTETAVMRFASAMDDLLNLDRDLNDLRSVYRSDLLEKVSSFHETHLALASKLPELTIRFVYATFAAEVHPNVTRQVERVRQIVENKFSHVAFKADLLTATDLLQLARTSPTSVHQLRLSESPIATGDQGYVCLVRLTDFCTFVNEEDGTLKERLFEGNVRDYQGRTEVNQAIRHTLENGQQEDFWWLNNGISVVCSAASLSGKTLTLENPEIVNGLQTSREIHNVFSSNENHDDKRSVLVRVLVPPHEESRDRIIRATNSQTSIPIASLRATDKVQRDIEAYFLEQGLFYDRRKNYYKNQGKPIKRIVSIPSLAQSVLAAALLDPGNARARPSSLLKRDEDYERIFNEDYPLNVYHVCAVLSIRIEDAFRSNACTVDRGHWNNLRFYTAMLAVLRLTGLPRPSVRSVANIDLNTLTEQFLLQCTNDVWNDYIGLGGTDQVAKGSHLSQVIQQSHRTSLGLPVA